MDFPIEVDGVVYYAGGNQKAYNDRHNGIHNPKDWVWRWSKKSLNSGLKMALSFSKRARKEQGYIQKLTLTHLLVKKETFILFKILIGNQI